MNYPQNNAPIIVSREPYLFMGPKAEKSAEYFDMVRSCELNGNTTYLVWDAAHKFGSKATGPGFVCYRHGLIYGERAQEASDFFNSAWEKAFEKCSQEGRRAIMKSVSNKLMLATWSSGNPRALVNEQLRRYSAVSLSNCLQSVDSQLTVLQNFSFWENGLHNLNPT